LIGLITKEERAMGAYIIRRILQMILVMLLVTVMVFLMVRLLPGDPIRMFLSSEAQEEISLEQVAQLRHEYGLDKPMFIQYVDWLGQIATGDLGQSIITRQKIMNDVKRRIPITFELGIIAFLLSICIGIPIGVIAAIRRGTWLDNVLTGFGNLGICVPSFWLGILLIYVIGYKLDLLPIFGFTSPFKDFSMNIRQIIMPVICLGVAPIATGIRLTRSSMLEVLRQDYVRTAWSKGLRERAVIVKHALKNGLLPVVTVKGMTLAGIVGGSVLIETVFSIPGMGRFAVEGLFAHDYPIVQATLLIGGTVTLGANLLVDLSYGWLDPRIRYR
jgi:peptide/nickel transport system permease protein